MTNDMAQPAGEDAWAKPGTADPMMTRRFHALELERHIGERLRFIRRLTGLSQRQVADEIGISFQQVQKYENGTNRVSAVLLAELAGLFRLPMDWFIGPFNACLEADQPEPAGSDYARVLDRLYRAFHDRSDTECDAALDLLCQVAGVGAGPAQTRLLRLRRALHETQLESRPFLLEMVRRLGHGRTRPGKEPAGEGIGPAARLVLLVDDDPDVLTTLSASLAGAGHVVTTATSGDEALTVLANEPRVSLIVTDYAMVGMDGVELLAQAAQLRPGLPSIVITGFANSERLRELPPGVEVLSKPFRRMELIGRTRVLLEGTGASPGGRLNRAA